MITKFEVGKSYTFNPPKGTKEECSIFEFGSMTWSTSMFKVLDGKPRLCTDVFDSYLAGASLGELKDWRWFPTTLEYWNEYKKTKYTQGEMEV